MQWGIPTIPTELMAMLPQLPGMVRELQCQLPGVLQELKSLVQSGRRTAAVLEQEFGVVGPQENPKFAARSLAALPLIEEGMTTTVDVVLNLEQLSQGRYPSRGFYANIGDNPFGVVLVGTDGRPSKAHTLLPGTTINITCYLKEIIIKPIEAQEAKYQVIAQ
ncbi:hypothetical protein [Deinococcus misasensis]|uniref:hypothetical protein n=1 Tax=Deinococcus misasensis TaxID=392413 RepID=UPI0012FB7CEC|nr:hypothetical protein [Deinococcus misasensis]